MVRGMTRTPSNTYNTNQAKPLSESFDADRSTQGETRRKPSPKSLASARHSRLRTPAPATRTKLTYCVNLPNLQQSVENLEIGLAKGIWGFLDATLQRADHFANLKDAVVGDELIFAYGGGSPFVPPGAWSGTCFTRVIQATITSPLYFHKAEIWKNEVYEHRIRFELVAELSGSVPLGPSICEALRMSGCNRGAAVVAIADVLKLSPFADTSAVTTLNHNGPTDGFRVTRFRREQPKLRKQLLTGSSGECALCGRNLPVELIEVGHIKRRTDSDKIARLDFNNVMRVCTFGCEKLFENGYVIVDATGIIREGKPSPSPDLSTFLSGLVERRCTSFGPESSVYFEAHRQRFSNE